MLRHAVGEDPKECFQAWHRCFGDVDPALFRRCKGGKANRCDTPPRVRAQLCFVVASTVTET